MQAIGVHVGAMVEYTLQCVDLAVFDSSVSASEKDNAVAIQFENIGFVELEHARIIIQAVLFRTRNSYQKSPSEKPHSCE